MLRPTLLVLAISCAITCTSFAQPGSQQAPPPVPPTSGQNAAPANPAPAVSNVPMNEPVLTLKGACEPKAGSSPPVGCVSSLTRQQFEQLTNALQPADKGPVPPDVRRKFATQYAKLLIFADVARQLGLENDPKVQQIFTFARNQILAESLNQHYVDEYAHPTDQQIQNYYNANPKKYTEATLMRVIIPVNQGGDDKGKPSEEEQKAFAAKVRERWAAGEDANKLEKDAMEHNGVTTPAPDVNVGARRVGALPEAHNGVFELKAGEVSPVYSDPAAFYIYKVVSIRQVPLNEVKGSISQALQRQMFTDKMQQVQSAVTPILNDAYFGPDVPATVPQSVIRPGGPATQSGTPTQKPQGAEPPNPGAPPQ